MRTSRGFWAGSGSGSSRADSGAERSASGNLESGFRLGSALLRPSVPIVLREVFRQIVERIEKLEGKRPLYGILDITLYRDDLNTKPPRPLEETSIPDGGVDETVVVLVDDVLYTGRSVRAALDALRDVGRPRAVQLAVFVDRGHREFPLRADYVGKNVPTSRTDNVKVRLINPDGHDGVTIASHGGPVR